MPEEERNPSAENTSPGWNIIRTANWRKSSSDDTHGYGTSCHNTSTSTSGTSRHPSGYSEGNHGELHCTNDCDVHHIYQQASLMTVYSLYDKVDELTFFLQSHDVDIAMVCKTHLCPSQTSRIGNYYLYRKDSTSGRGGGTAIYVRRSIDHSEIDTPSLQGLEANAVVVATASGPLRLIAAYCRPQNYLILQDLNELLSSDQPKIIAGDLNSKHPAWNRRRTNRKGRALLDYATTNDLQVLALEEPTFFHRAGAAAVVLDVALLKDVSWLPTLYAINDLSSDHNPVIMELTMDPTTNDTDGSVLVEREFAGRHSLTNSPRQSACQRSIQWKN